MLDSFSNLKTEAQFAVHLHNPAGCPSVTCLETELLMEGTRIFWSRLYSFKCLSSKCYILFHDVHGKEKAYLQ